MKKLTPKELKFCREYVKCCNATKAATKAGYSQKTARQQGCVLLTKPNIAAEVKRLQYNLSEMAGINNVMIALELKKLAFSNIADSRSGWLTLKDFNELSEDAKAAFSEIQYETRTVGEAVIEGVKIKMHNKIDALKELNNMLGFNAPKKLEVTGNNGAAIQQNITCEVVFKDYSKNG